MIVVIVTKALMLLAAVMLAFIGLGVSARGVTGSSTQAARDVAELAAVLCAMASAILAFVAGWMWSGCYD